MRIAITGGAGFIGSALTKAYLDAGHDVLVIDNLQSGSERMLDPRARFYHVDIRNRQVQQILQAERPEVVSHHAAQHIYTLAGEPSLADADVHIRGLLTLLDACVESNVRKLIFASGGASLYGTTERNLSVLTEESSVTPQQPHDISKVAGEWYVRYYTQHYGLKHNILRYADVYGESARMELQHLHHPLSYFIRMLHEGRRPLIHSAYEEQRDQIFIADVVEANLRLLTQADNETLHISTGEAYSLKELFQLVAKRMRSNLEPVYLTGALEEGSSSMLDPHKAYTQLGWRARTDIQTGLAHALALLGIHLPQEVSTKEAAEVQNREVVLSHI